MTLHLIQVILHLPVLKAEDADNHHAIRITLIRDHELISPCHDCVGSARREPACPRGEIDQQIERAIDVAEHARDCVGRKLLVPFDDRP